MALYHLRVFARFREQIGRDSVSLDGPDRWSAADLLARFFSQHPELNGLQPVTRLAVNQSFVGLDYPVQPSDELALIPPVSGG